MFHCLKLQTFLVNFFNWSFLHAQCSDRIGHLGVLHQILKIILILKWEVQTSLHYRETFLILIKQVNSRNLSREMMRHFIQVNSAYSTKFVEYISELLKDNMYFFLSGRERRSQKNVTYTLQPVYEKHF